MQATATGEKMNQPVCLVSGAGDGTGAAIARRFASGNYRIALLARTEERLKRLEREIPGSQGYVCDIGNPDLLRETIVRSTRYARKRSRRHHGNGQHFGVARQANSYPLWEISQ